MAKIAFDYGIDPFESGQQIKIDKTVRRISTRGRNVTIIY